jgi:hypothetical protein
MCFRRILVVVAVLLSLVSPAFAEGTRLIGDPMRDVQQTVHARRLLADDPELKEHHIGVAVRDRVATLWGPVPSAEVAFRAELCLRMMIELAEVRNELVVSDLMEPVRRPLKIDAPPRYVPEPMPPNLPRGARSLLGAPIRLMGEDGTVGKRPASQQNLSERSLDIKELPPIALPKQGSPHVGGETSSEADQRLVVAVRAILQSKDSFGPVLFAVKEGRIYLKTSGPDSEVLHDAAQAVSRLPNVVGVILVESSSRR